MIDGLSSLLTLEMGDLKNIHSINTKIVKIGLGESFIESLLNNSNQDGSADFKMNWWPCHISCV